MHGREALCIAAIAEAAMHDNARLSIRFLIFAFAISDARWMHSFAGPYFMVLHRHYNCAIGEKGYDGGIHWTVKFSRFNPHKRDEMQTKFINERIVFDTWSNNKWTPNAIVFNYPSKGCSMMKQNLVGNFSNFFQRDSSGGCVIP
ncbi:hypothetical protein FOCC_FOCC013483, partial [Frankliniella occidentalis]